MQLPPNQQQHNQDGNVAHKLWLAALESNWSIALFRDETVPIHSFVQSFFDTLKGYGKRVSEVKEAHTHATQKALVLIVTNIENILCNTLYHILECTDTVSVVNTYERHLKNWH